MTYTMDSPAAQVAGILADASTTNPATGTWRHYSQDSLGSTRRLRASDKSSLGVYEYTPYGQTYTSSGVALGDLAGAFTGKAWDDTSQLYYFPYRYYSPDAARWLTRDPLGMVDGPNVYAYVKGDPVGYWDVLGFAGKKGSKTEAQCWQDFFRRNQQINSQFASDISPIVRKRPVNRIFRFFAFWGTIPPLH